MEYGWYYRFSRFLKETFAERVYKIPISLDFNCPNRDGTKGQGGCTYCYNPGFSQSFVNNLLPVREQVLKGKENLEKKQGKVKFISYFQSYTNTYAPVETLETLYQEALAPEGAVGLSVATRPDCVNEEILAMLDKFTSSKQVWLEYGLQSIHDKTLSRINRGHDANCFYRAMNMTRQHKNILVCVHVILGLPGEDREDMLKTAQVLNDLSVDAVKIHHLQVMKNTPLAQQYQAGEFAALSLLEHVNLAADFLEYLSPTIVIQRLVGETFQNDLLIAPRWNMSKTKVVSMIEKELASRCSYQGKKASK